MNQLAQLKCGIFQVIFGIVLSIAHLNGFAQDNIGALRNQFDSYAKNTPQEKIFVHTDKEVYIAGELIWFKTYSVNAANNKPVDLSKVAYVEVIDKDRNSVIQTKIALKEGSGSGSFYIPVALASGTYQIRAYTNWMKNFSQDYFFAKPISIINSLAKPDTKPQEQAMAYDIQLFPEGGNLVEGIAGKVAFRITDQNGKGVDFKGAIINASNDTIVRFSPLKFGIGNFAFTPAPNTSYKTVITIPGSPKIVKDIPSVSKTGYTMQVTDAGSGSLKVAVQSNAGSQGELVYLFVHTREQTDIAEGISLANGRAEITVDKNKLADGISHFTVFNSSKQPVAERLYFKRPDEKLLIQADASKTQYSTRQEVNISILAKDETGKEQAGDLSVSVFPAIGSEAESADIYSYLWLSSDLKGSVESPGYYFKNADLATNEALDNLMLTHGWRRFLWNEVLQGKIPAFTYVPEYEGHIITGKLTDIKTGVPAKNIMSYLAVPGKIVQLYGSKSSDEGDIRFYTKDFYGPGDIVVQTNYMVDSTYRAEIHSPFVEKATTASNLPGFSLTSALREQVLKQSLGTQVQNVYSGNKLRVFYAPPRDSTSFYLKPDKEYLLDNYVRFKTMEEVLREYVLELSISRENRNYLLWTPVQPYYNIPYRNVVPLLLMDGVPVFDRGNRIIAYDPTKVQRLQTVSQKYFLGPLSFDAIASFTTYKGNMQDFQLDPKATVMDYEGMQLQREFYSPVYDTESKAASRIPDFRNVLYWSPDLKIDASGKKSFSFYTSDQENKYTVVIQGNNSSGRSGATVFNIDVKK